MAAIPTDTEFAYYTMTKVYPCTSLKLKLFNRKAIKSGYNRIIADVDRVDSKGIHLLQLALPMHVNHAGKVSVRVLCYINYAGRSGPTKAYLDISHKDWRDFCSITDSVSPTVIAKSAM